jgi:protein SCO1/2
LTTAFDAAFARAMPQDTSPSSSLRIVRLLLWLLVAVALAGVAAMLLLRRGQPQEPVSRQLPLQARLGGPFTLTDGNGRPFSSAKLAGKPYAIFFGFTRCGDVCPTTLGRLVNLRRQAGPEAALNILFVTIDPQNDGSREVGQYAGLFGSPITGLTGTPQQIDAVKKLYAIHAAPVPHAPKGQEMEHTGAVLLFDRAGQFVSTLRADEADAAALEKLRALLV